MNEYCFANDCLCVNCVYRGICGDNGESVDSCYTVTCDKFKLKDV